ncbi:hypothetical protein F5Y12DRAFT_769649 [Xylaria sp. FL1777]|nr:hypothetical protein F5Y12DRAFT_769649 [Xylaria sp. FL1777]
MSTTTVLSLVGWAFLPSLVTGWVQSIYYGLTIRAGDSRPQPNSPRWQQHRRRIHTLVITLYLLYTIYEAHWELQRRGSFYASLGVPLNASERIIKSRFRRLAALHHPDKVSHTAGASDAADDFFIHLKTAAEALTDPVRRFAYERFGPDILAWRNCITLRDYVWWGLQTQVLMHYGVAAAGLYGLGLLGYLDVGRHWRWVTLLCLCTFEAHTVMCPRFPAFLDTLVNPFLVRFTSQAPYLPFQAIDFARRVALAISIAIGQLAPVLRPANAADDKALEQNLDRLEQTAKTMDADAMRLMELEMAPFVGDSEVVKEMRSKLKEWLVQNTIRADPMVRDALGRSLQKRRVDAPAGARGTK